MCERTPVRTSSDEGEKILFVFWGRKKHNVLVILIIYKLNTNMEVANFIKKKIYIDQLTSHKNFNFELKLIFQL